MPPRRRESCQRKALSTCVITTLVFSIAVLIFVVLHSSWQPVLGQDPDPDPCSSKVVVATDERTLWNTSGNFAQAWSDAERKARTPAHSYMEKRHSVAIYVYTQAVGRPGRTVLAAVEGSGKRLDSETRSLFSYLSEAVQILRRGQTLCRTTSYAADAASNLSSPGPMLRFADFALGSGACSPGGGACFEVRTCFGADVTLYSALKQNSQVLIPPYEVFRVTAVPPGPRGGQVTHKLESNLNCVYDSGSDSLHPISASPADLHWVIFGIVCIVVVFLFLPFVIFKVLKK